MVEREVPGTRVVNLLAAKRFFVLSKTIPGMGGVIRGGDAPEVKGLGAAILGVDNHLNENDGAGHELAVFVVGGGVGVVADTIVIVDEGGSNGLPFELGDIEGGEAAFQLVFEVVFVLGVKVVAFAEVGEELGENSDLFRILSGAQSNTLIGMGAPVAEFAFFYVGEDFFLGDSEIEYPSVGGVEVVRLDETKLGDGGWVKGESRLDTEKESVLLVSEVLEGGEGLLEGFFGVLGVEGGAVRAVEVIAERGGMLNGEELIAVTIEPKSLMAFEFRISFPLV